MTERSVSALLDRGERLIWSGRPAPFGYVLKKGGLQWFFGLFFFAFSIFWIYGAGMASQKSGGFFWLFGIPFVLVGTAMVFSPAWYYVKAGRTQFALTDRRAIIDMQGFMGKRISVPLGRMPFVELQLGAGGGGHVLFMEASPGYQKGVARRDGFLAIADASDVERKLRDAIDAKMGQPAK